ncbi:MAG: PLDc N-terminal domain-containing protein [Bacteroidota bacterium]|nr:PLDc N-terminal domain-containing protein [Bacteroidota bacterium]
MTKSRKLLLGILTLLPIVLTIVFLASFFSFFIGMIRSGGDEQMAQEWILGNFLWIVLMSVILGLLHLGLLIYFIVHAINNGLVSSNERIVWILVFIFVGTIGMPIYWYLRIWRADDTPARQQ